MWPRTEPVSRLGKESDHSFCHLPDCSFLVSVGVHKELNPQRGKLCDWPIYHLNEIFLKTLHLSFLCFHVYQATV